MERKHEAMTLAELGPLALSAIAGGKAVMTPAESEDKVLEAVADGSADAVLTSRNYSSYSFGHEAVSTRYSAVRFKDRDLGEAVRMSSVIRYALALRAKAG